MRRGVLILATTAAAALLGACGGGEVVVMAQLQEQTADTAATEGMALGSLQVRLIPFDRDVIFDSLAQAYPEPEPQLPDTVEQLQDVVMERYQEWQQANARWGVLRDSLKTIADRMNRMDPGSGEYFALFQDFSDLEGEVETLQRRADESFQEFTALQTRLNNMSQEIRIQHRAWADDAFAPVDSVMAARLEASRREVHVDTTDSRGVARFRGIRPGEWWVHARYDRQFDELYWNEPIEVGRGEEVVVRLTRENAEPRQKM